MKTTLALCALLCLASASRAADLSGQMSISFGKSNSTMQAAESISVNTTSVYYLSTVQSIGTADVTVALGDLPSIGYVMLRNLSSTSTSAPTATLLIGPDGSGYPLALKPGESGLFRWNAAALHLKASTNTLNAAIRILSN